jgi:hypothetical protein
MLNRRETLKISAGALLTSALGPGLAAGQAARTRILLLGTAGGPPPADYAGRAFERHRSRGGPLCR